MDEITVFISYSHSDREKVLPISSYLVRLGVKVWIDTKELSAGESIVEKVSDAISRANLYIIAISPSALKSRWVNHELNTALTSEISLGKPKVLPIVVEKSEIPASIRSRLYIDFSGDKEKAKENLKKVIGEYLPSIKSEITKEISELKPELFLASVILQLRKNTIKYHGGGSTDTPSKEEVEEEAFEITKKLRRKANGILLNFLSAGEMDFKSKNPRFPNGELTEYTKDDTGDYIGTFTMQSLVNVEIVNPSEDKLNQLFSSKLESLGVASVTYTFLISHPIDNLAQKALSRLQDNYVILGWDADEGADVELPDDLKLSILCNDDRIRISIETKYQFQFESRAKEFSVRDFVNWVAGIEKLQIYKNK